MKRYTFLAVVLPLLGCSGGNQGEKSYYRYRVQEFIRKGKNLLTTIEGGANPASIRELRKELAQDPARTASPPPGLEKAGQDVRGLSGRLDELADRYVTRLPEIEKERRSSRSSSPFAAGADKKGSSRTMEEILAEAAKLRRQLNDLGEDAGFATVSGRVTYRGQPVTGHYLMLESVKAHRSPQVRQYHISLSGDGRFEESCVEPDSYQVYLDPGPGHPGAQGSEGPDLPAKYRKRDTSGLTWDVSAGKNEKDFNLE